MRFKFRRTMALLIICLLMSEFFSGLSPFRNERAYAGTGGVIDTVAGGEYGDEGDGYQAVDAELANPSAVAVDSSGNLYIADTGNNKIRKVAANGTISTVAGSGNYGYSGDGNLAINADLRNPSGVAVDSGGNLYIADKYNNRIRKVDAASGNISTIAGTGASGFGGDDGDAVDAELRSPSGVAVDGLGNVYIADTGNSRIRKVAANGTITTVAGVSDYGTFSGDGGAAVDADLSGPAAVAVDSHGNLYIADTDNNRIRKVDTSGTISTVAGSSSVDGGDGGPAVDARLNEPEGVWADGAGNVYIADTDNNRIRKVSPSGIITTISGTGTAGYSGDGGQGILAELHGPTGLAMDSGGNLYVADKFNYAIRKQTMYIPSNDARLSGIALSSGTLSPAFDPNATEYGATVVNGVSSIRVTPTMAADSFVTVKVNGQNVAGGAQSGDITLNVGLNLITLVALAEDGATAKTYKITVERLKSSNADLSQLTLSNGTLSPAFSSITQGYSANASQSAITVTPTLADAMAAVKVNGTPVASGAASQPIPLAVGSTEIKVEVTAQDGTTTKLYTINVTRTISANADLSGLTLSNGTLTPAFDAGTLSYAASVGNSVSSITVTPTTADGSAAVSVNDEPVASGAASASIPLIVGSNTVTVKITAENGASKTYTVAVTRAASSDADLSDLELSSGELTPSFLPGTYKASVGNGVSSVTIKPTVSDAAHATVKVSLFDGSGTLVSGPSPVASGTTSAPLALGVGVNTITLLVTAEDGTTKTYTVTVTRGASSNAELSDLTLSSGTLSPAFGGTYTASVGNGVSSIAVTAALSDAGHASATASVYDSGGTLAGGPHVLTSGAASPALPLSVGDNKVAVLVTAQDGSVRTYTITVTRAALSGSADLSGLTLSSGTLNPAFDAGTISYAASVGNSVSSITVTPTTADGSAAVSVNDEPVASGAASASIPLIVGSNTVTVKITAENGASKTYTVAVTRAASSDADLSDLELSSGELTPSFLPGTYKASVGNGVSSVTIKPTVSDSAHATVKVSLYDGSGTLVSGPSLVTSGTASAPLALGVGVNTITLLVTAEDSTTKTYTVTVTRGASSNAELSNLTLSSGTLTPAFGGTYTASVGNSVSSLTVTATLSDADHASVTASVYGNDGTLAGGPHMLTSGAASPSLLLSVGDNEVSVLVTAQDGSARTYTITVTRAALSGSSELSGLTLSSGTLTPAFDAGTLSYTASVGNSVSNITITMEASDADRAAITASVYTSAGTLISGPFAMSSGTAAFSLPLVAGSNPISIVVRTYDGATKTYGLDITRQASSTGGGGGGGGGGEAAPVADESDNAKPHIDLNGQALDPADIDTRLPFVTLEATPKDGVAYVSVPASVLTELALNNADFYLEIKTPYGSYRVPVHLADLIPGLPELLAQSKLQAGDISFKITLTDKSGDKALQAALAADLPNGKVMGAMVDYHIDIVDTRTGQTIGAAAEFSEALARMIPLPGDVTALPALWGAFRYNETAKTFEFVPATSVQIDGIWYVTIDSYSNSTYVVAENAASFGDMQRHWAQSLVGLAAAKGLVEGVGGGRYAPDNAVTRAEFATMLVRALGRGASSDVGASGYGDVAAGAWYAGAVAAAKELGLPVFAQGGDFKPDQPLTREEMAGMLAAAVRLEKLPIPADLASLDGYRDIGSADDSYLEAIRLMAKLQIMTGTGADTFSPQGETTRAQAAVVFIRLLRQLDMID